MDLTEATNQVKVKIQDEAEKLQINDLQEIILNSLQLFSSDLPREIVGDIDGDGNYDYTPPTGWADGFSNIKQIEYPAGRRIPESIESQDYTIYDDGVTKKVRFLNHTPATGEKARITFTIPYVQSTINTIPAHHIDAFINLVSSNCCMAIAVLMGFVQNPTLQVDAVNYHNKGSDFSKRSKEFRTLYDKVAGKADGVKGASYTVNWNTKPTWQSDFLTHPNRHR